ncbi:MAG: flavin reductase [Spirochaetota bacterium]|nr:flavin reductase [Spirochaetota bacterium]
MGTKINSRVFHKISYGLYIIASQKGEKVNGQICNTVIQVTSSPPMVAVAINKQNFTHECISNSDSFSISILSQDAPLSLIGNFGFKCGRDYDKCKDINYRKGSMGTPIIIEHALGYLELKLVQRMDVGTHTIFVGEVIEAELIEDGEPMTYSYYHQIKRGKTPESAPTFIKDEKKDEKHKENNISYRCTVCGYVYEPGKGDPESGVAPGTSFADLPADWVCPICGAGKDKFEKL